MVIPVKIYRTYRWRDKNPIIDALRTIKEQERLNYSQISQLSGVAAATMKNWFEGDTRKPFDHTATAMSSALGYVRHDRLRKDGTVAPAFEKARAYDWRDELERAADWMLKNDPATMKRKAKQKKKPNGKGSA
jgi:transcriptional regulator with XRE-family HTH domain